jgi:hypothetical protein
MKTRHCHFGLATRVHGVMTTVAYGAVARLDGRGGGGSVDWSWMKGRWASLVTWAGAGPRHAGPKAL